MLLGISFEEINHYLKKLRTKITVIPKTLVLEGTGGGTNFTKKDKGPQN